MRRPLLPGLLLTIGAAAGPAAGASCPADVSGDETVNATDLVAVVLAWGPCPAPCPADVNGDGLVDDADLVEVILGWGTCACDPSGSFVVDATGAPWNPAAGYQLGSGVDLRLLLQCADPDDVVFQVWSNGVHAATMDGARPFVYEANALDGVPAGPGVIQALLRYDGQPPFATLTFPTTFVAGPSDDPGETPGPVCGDGVCESGESPASCPTDCGGGGGAAIQLWLEDWEQPGGGYDRWTLVNGVGYWSSWSDCASSGYSLDTAVSPSHSHRSVITCADSQSHRGYAILRFDGDEVVPSAGIIPAGGIDSPHGVVATFWNWMEVPYAFDNWAGGNGTWVSMMTVSDDCTNGWGDVITLGIEDPSNRLTPAHVDSKQFVSGAPAFPLGEWVRITVYVNYYDGELFVWQNGEPVVSATFSRPGVTACNWHFGLYASGPNDDILLYEDDLSIWKLTEPWTDFDIEPAFQE